MTVDVVALCRTRPDVEPVLGALLAAGPQLLVQPMRHGAVQLLDEDGRPLLAVDGPRLVQVPGEVTRILGPATADALDGQDAPLWWVEVRAPSAHPHGAAVARQLADALVDQLGGTVWPTRPAAGPVPPATTAS